MRGRAVVVWYLAVLWLQGAKGNRFDGDTTVYSPEGRLYQVEYAQEATGKGCSIVGVAEGSWSVLAAWRPTLSPSRSTRPRLIWDVDTRVGLAAVGLRSDVQYIANTARTECSGHMYAWGTNITCRRLARKLADVVHDCTRRAGKRPLAVDALIAGTDVDGKASLIRLMPSGSLQAWKACAIGAHSKEASACLVETQRESDELGIQLVKGEEDAEGAIKKLTTRALKALSKAAEAGGALEMDASDVCLAVYGGEGSPILFSPEEIEGLRAEASLSPTPSPPP